ncbi:hypothetical protein VBD025_16645 [Virgibacillus flavescens]|uniref:hypothetical protein n=1 Tax=Virgibacillus flavescens TaxID=1611422 RepID=UPI003D349DAF
MNETISQIINVSGIIFGLLMFFLSLKKGLGKEKYWIILSISIVFMCTTSFVLTLSK